MVVGDSGGDDCWQLVPLEVIGAIKNNKNIHTHTLQLWYDPKVLVFFTCALLTVVREGCLSTKIMAVATF